MIKPFINDVLYVLQSSKVGDTVDNGCGVEFDIKEYAIVALKDVSDKFDDEKYMCLTVEESETAMLGMLDRLYEDGYEIIWNNKEYKLLEQTKFEIVRCGVDVSVKIHRMYRLTIKFDDIRKHYADRVNVTELNTHDLFYQLFENGKLSNLATGAGFVTDNVRLDDVKIRQDELVFEFHCKNEIGYQCKPVNYSFRTVTQEQSDAIQLKFENPNLSIDLIDKMISELMKS
jgi:hypothetical protein